MGAATQSQLAQLLKVEAEFEAADRRLRDQLASARETRTATQTTPEAGDPSEPESTEAGDVGDGGRNVSRWNCCKSLFKDWLHCVPIMRILVETSCLGWLVWHIFLDNQQCRYPFYKWIISNICVAPSIYWSIRSIMNWAEKDKILRHQLKDITERYRKASDELHKQLRILSAFNAWNQSCMSDLCNEDHLSLQEYLEQVQTATHPSDGCQPMSEVCNKALKVLDSYIVECGAQKPRSS
mmetsp:Transcript_63238/g.159488  ORF Transcript_63238/g.159488 Transcript_63238/m.159488 type:complete len:239 (-) Transcript_63238:12-728(-)